MPVLTIVGNGDATDPARPNTSLLLRGEATPTILMDCGYAVPHALWAISRDPNLIDGIFISHTHADHAFGLPPLLLWMRLHQRTRGLALLGTQATLDGIDRILALGYPGSFAPHKCFPIDRVRLGTRTVDWRGLRLRCAPTSHKIQNHALRVDLPDVSVAYSGDGEPTAESLELFRGVDWLVHECATLDGGIPGHAHWQALGPACEAHEVQNLVLVHQSPSERPKIAAAVSQPTKPRLRVHLPSAGDELRLGPGDD